MTAGHTTGPYLPWHQPRPLEVLRASVQKGGVSCAARPLAVAAGCFSFLLLLLLLYSSFQLLLRDSLLVPRPLPSGCGCGNVRGGTLTWATRSDLIFSPFLLARGSFVLATPSIRGGVRAGASVEPNTAEPGLPSRRLFSLR